MTYGILEALYPPPLVVKGIYSLSHCIRPLAVVRNILRYATGDTLYYGGATFYVSAIYFTPKHEYVIVITVVHLAGENSRATEDSSASSLTSNIKTKKLFVTGLSFYTSEKTLRSAFEGFGELVEVKIIMDKISKRSKGYAFLEYTTVEAASTALREMSGKIINGWMITVDVAKENSPKYSKGQPRPTS
ncbi:glycine-rich RNA-binding protein 4 mitochondrial [Phtheirospermum japonicum]|uniref:Glycine-rich RNA-binding protein 4 mitochondrial n=1 Tax=Phtheirospermum japonicum TaxID=374723 RepID=A0A830CHM1_9LAMI|nr:glycine-rich RNA-binding protein 4 mitochondrial [Phtheirospermum japonicum]